MSDQLRERFAAKMWKDWPTKRYNGYDLIGAGITLVLADAMDAEVAEFTEAYADKVLEAWQACARDLESDAVAELISIKNHESHRTETFACINVGQQDGYDPPDTVTVISRQPLYLACARDRESQPATFCILAMPNCPQCSSSTKGSRYCATQGHSSHLPTGGSCYMCRHPWHDGCAREAVKPPATEDEPLTHRFGLNIDGQFYTFRTIQGIIRKATTRCETVETAWISVEERLPPLDPYLPLANCHSSDNVLIQYHPEVLRKRWPDDEDWDVFVACLCEKNTGEQWWEMARPGPESDRLKFEDVTRWMSLPEPPGSANPNQAPKEALVTTDSCKCFHYDVMVRGDGLIEKCMACGALYRDGKWIQGNPSQAVPTEQEKT